MVRDPYETATVRVAESRVPGSGEGLFATRNIKKGGFIYINQACDQTIDHIGHSFLLILC
jgi:hypothetical protein